LEIVVWETVWTCTTKPLQRSVSIINWAYIYIYIYNMLLVLFNLNYHASSRKKNRHCIMFLNHNSTMSLEPISNWKCYIFFLCILDKLLQWHKVFKKNCAKFVGKALKKALIGIYLKCNSKKRQLIQFWLIQLHMFKDQDYPTNWNSRTLTYSERT
jgi:hypothetical protein